MAQRRANQPFRVRAGEDNTTIWLLILRSTNNNQNREARTSWKFCISCAHKWSRLSPPRVKNRALEIVCWLLLRMSPISGFMSHCLPILNAILLLFLLHLSSVHVHRFNSLVRHTQHTEILQRLLPSENVPVRVRWIVSEQAVLLRVSGWWVPRGTYKIFKNRACGLSILVLQINSWTLWLVQWFLGYLFRSIYPCSPSNEFRSCPCSDHLLHTRHSVE